MDIWNRHFECMSRDELRYIQTERLRETVERIYFNVPYYRNRMQELGLGPEAVRTLEDLKKLPFTTKNDLRHNYPFGLFAVPMSEIVRLHASWEQQVPLLSVTPGMIFQHGPRQWPYTHICRSQSL